MAELQNFEIKDNILIKYLGNDINVTIPDGIKIIGKYAFNDCKDIESVAIPEGVEVIEQAAFLGCEKLNNVVFPESLKCIENSAFFNCYNLTDINIPDRVTEIGDQAFSGCINLQIIKLPKGLKVLNSKLFADCEKLEVIDIPNHVTIINEDVFLHCLNLKSINMPMGLESIGDSAFKNCSNLIYITIPDSVIEIGNEAFSDCNQLHSIELGTRLKKIGSEAFRNCSNLNDITIPDSVNEIGKKVFFDCEQLYSIKMGFGLEKIGSESFKNCLKLKNIIIPNGVHKIEKETFSRCSELENVELSNSINEIDHKAFYNCPNLIISKMPQELKEIYFDTFEGCNLNNIQMPDEMIIKCNSFNYTKDGQLKEYFGTDVVFNIPNCVKIIKRHAFYKNKNIVQINIPKEVVKIEEGAFDGCTNLTKVNVDNDNNNYFIDNYILYNKNKTEIIFALKCIKGTIKIPEGVTTISKSAFANCSKIRFIDFPESLSEIQDFAFKNCWNLSDVKINENVKKIGKKAFAGCDKDEISLNKEFSLKITYGRFKNGYDIEIIPGQKSEKLLDMNSTEFKLPNNVNKIKQGTFKDFKNLETIVIPDSVSWIEDNAFEGCCKLTEIEIPESVKEIGDGIFKGCVNLNKVVLKNKNTKLKLSWFDNDVFIKVMEDYSSDQLDLQSSFEEIVSLFNNKSLNENCKEKLRNNLSYNNSWLLEYISSNFKFNAYPILIQCIYKFIISKSKELSFLTENHLIRLTDFEELLNHWDRNDHISYIDSFNENYKSIPYIEEFDKIIDKESETTPVVENPSEKNNWSYKKLDDGTLKIKNYKGTDSEVTVPSTIDNMKVSTIGSEAFYPKQKQFEWVWNREDVTKLIVSQGIEVIEDNVFKRCINLTEIILPESIKYIGFNRFYECNTLLKVQIDENNNNFFLKDDILYEKKSLRIVFVPKIIKGRISLPDGITEIPDYAFENCIGITEINIPGSVIKIGKFSFSGCSNIQKISIPRSVTEIGQSAFESCVSLNKVKLSDGITKLPGSIFAGCCKLSEILVPSTVNYISESAFNYLNQIIIVGKKGSYAEKFVKKLQKKDDIYNDASESYKKKKKNTDGFLWISEDKYIKNFINEQSWKYNITFEEK